MSKYNFGFIIPTCCFTDIHLRQLFRCINSVLNLYPDIHIILINDSDVYNLNDIFSQSQNIIIFKSLIKGSADQQIFKVFQDNIYFDKAIFMQDSMLLNAKIDNIESINFQFLWHFTNHRIHWNNIFEPKTEFNLVNKIHTHADLIKFAIKNYYPRGFSQFALENMHDMNKWVGCFGSLCIIDKVHLNYMNSKVPFVDFFISSNSNRNRRANESIFALIAHYCFPNYSFQNSLDGLYYDGYTTNIYNGHDTSFDNLLWTCKMKYFSKISFDR